jgi:hypothetical protein
LPLPSPGVVTSIDFEYDVFISFASGDESLVKPLWQELTASGLRVFWSDATLRERMGRSWFEAIEESLGRSKHFVVVCTPASLESRWVKLEWIAFFNHCYQPPSRLLVPILAEGTSVGDLPLFLRDIEACSLRQPDLVRRLIRILGGVDIAALQARLSELEDELSSLRSERNTLADKVRELTSQKKPRRSNTAEDRTKLAGELEALKHERDLLLHERSALRVRARAAEDREQKLSRELETHQASIAQIATVVSEPTDDANNASESDPMSLFSSAPGCSWALIVLVVVLLVFIALNSP